MQNFLPGVRLPNPAPNSSSFVPFCFSSEAFRVISFNGRGIVVEDDFDRQQYIKHLRKLVDLQRPDAVCLQEVHGLEADVELSLGRAFPGWRILSSHCLGPDGLPYPSAGGTAILVSPKIAHLATAEKLVLHPGRIMVAILRLGDKVLNIINIHNAALPLVGVKRAVEFLAAARTRDTLSPLDSASILIGDINFLASGDRRFKAGRPVAASLRAPASTSATFRLFG